MRSYRAPDLCRAAGITYRQLDYWARTGLVNQSVRVPNGSGDYREFSERDVRDAALIATLLEAGLSLQSCRPIMDLLRPIPDELLHGWLFISVDQVEIVHGEHEIPGAFGRQHAPFHVVSIDDATRLRELT